MQKNHHTENKRGYILKPRSKRVNIFEMILGAADFDFHQEMDGREHQVTARWKQPQISSERLVNFDSGR